jgi:hypothetical protein
VKRFEGEDIEIRRPENHGLLASKSIYCPPCVDRAEDNYIPIKRDYSGGSR